MDRARARYLADSALSGHGVPAHRPSLEGLPRAFISCAEIDPCRDEAVEYAIRLFQAYVHTELHPPDDRVTFGDHIFGPVEGTPMPPGGPESAAARNYIATSNGDWAKTNDSYHDEATVRSTWTITSTCSNPVDCTGQVTSDQGWTAPILHNSDAWIVQRELPSWKRCPDGYVATGHQRYRFWPVDATGYVAVGSPMLTGEEKGPAPAAPAASTNCLSSGCRSGWTRWRRSMVVPAGVPSACGTSSPAH